MIFLCPHAPFLLDHHIMVIDVPSSPCYEYAIIDYITDKYCVLGVLKHQLVFIAGQYYYVVDCKFVVICLTGFK